MSKALTLQYEKFFPDGNYTEKLYLMAMTAEAYVANGIVFNNDEFPDDEKAFESIQDVYFTRGNFKDDASLFAKIGAIDNSDSDEPSFKVRVYEQGTGGVMQELSASDPVTLSLYVKIIGVPKGGIVG